MIKKMLRSIFLWLQLLYDRILGCDFAAPLVNHEIGIARSDGNRYQATTPRIYRAICRQLKGAHMEDSILDVGCGKGRMLYLFHKKCSFGKVDGLEYSTLLAGIARQNMNKLQLTSEIYIEDAARFTLLDYNFFYICNSLPEKPMQSFVSNLCENIKQNPRKVTVLYFNPVCKECFLEHGFHTVSFKGGLMVLRN